MHLSKQCNMNLRLHNKRFRQSAHLSRSFGGSIKGGIFDQQICITRLQSDNSLMWLILTGGHP